MRIYGLDFTSAPSERKPIICAVCGIDADVLYIDGFVALESFALFENFLDAHGPWMAGMDFPFGQPRALIQNLSWPDGWENYVSLVAGLEFGEFAQMLKNYRDQRRAGDKHHLRETDRRAQSRSPMMLHGVPVARMFFRGAPRLLRSDAHVHPCRPGDSDRVAVEAYPALVARRFVGRRSYKNDTRSKQTTEQETARQDIVAGLRSFTLCDAYKLRLGLPEAIAKTLIADPSADSLDAVLCAIQAAWAWSVRDEGFGMPADVDPDEGWIVDPALVDRQTVERRR